MQGLLEIDCAAATNYSNRFRGEAVVVVHDGQIVCENYRTGGPDEAIEIASGVKSFAAVMAAAAVQDGLLTLDEPASATLTEWADDPRLSRITIRELLSLVSGLQVRLDRHYTYANAIDVHAIADPGERFGYGPRPFAIFGEIMRRKLRASGVDLTPAEYFRARILIPIDADVATWSAYRGDSILAEGVEVTPVRWARFGHLVLNGGAIGDVRLADASAIMAMFEQRFRRVYGMGWWVHHRGHAPPDRYVSSTGDIETAPADFPTVWSAQGSGDQRLYLLPEYDLVVVRMTRGVRRDRRLQRDIGFSGQIFLRALLPQIDREIAG